MSGLLLKEAPTDGIRSYHCEIDPSHETIKQQCPALHLKEAPVAKIGRPGIDSKRSSKHNWQLRNVC